VLSKFLNSVPMSSGWASQKEFIDSGALEGSWIDPPEEGGIVLYSEGDRLLMDGGNECRSTLIVGASGGGKSRLVVMNSMLQLMRARSKRSIIATDVKGELESMTRKIAEREGYEIWRINFRDLSKSNSWNPFGIANVLYRIGKKEEAWKNIEEIIAVIFSDGAATKTDPFWRTISASIFRGIVDIIWRADKDITMTAILRLSDTIPARSELDDRCELFHLADSLPQSAIGRSSLEALRRASDNNRGSVLATYRTYLAPLASRKDVLKMISGANTLDFQKIATGDRPVVLYIGMPDDSSATGSLQGILITQIYQELTAAAMKNGGRLPRPTEMMLDEVANIQPAIALLPSALTVCRSRGIRFVLAIQSYAQLISTYGSDMANTISSNCATWIALNCAKDFAFRERLSALCGENELGQPLITSSQLALMPYGTAIVLRERSKPYYTKLEDVSLVMDRINSAPNKSSCKKDQAVKTAA